MKKKLLIAGFACVSLMVIAQSSGTKDQAATTAKDAHPKEVASGQASGQTVAPKDLSSGHASGKTAQDDWQAPAAAKTSVPANSNGQTRVATGDVNGDGKADAAINTSHSNIKNTKDAASGQASGKRMHGDVVVTKTTDAASPK